MKVTPSSINQFVHSHCEKKGSVRDPLKFNGEIVARLRTLGNVIDRLHPKLMMKVLNTPSESLEGLVDKLWKYANLELQHILNHYGNSIQQLVNPEMLFETIRSRLYVDVHHLAVSAYSKRLLSLQEDIIDTTCH